MKPLLKTSDVCELLGVSRKTVNRLHRDGFLPKIKVGAQTVRYRQEDLDKLVQRRRLI